MGYYHSAPTGLGNAADSYLELTYLMLDSAALYSHLCV